MLSRSFAYFTDAMKEELWVTAGKKVVIIIIFVATITHRISHTDGRLGSVRERALQLLVTAFQVLVRNISDETDDEWGNYRN